MLRVGSSGSAVKALQQKLGITADGIFGPQTEAAVRAYQKAHGLSVDGIAGPQTLGSLGLSSSGTGSTGSTSTSHEPTEQEKLAANFGWSLAVINSDPQIKQIFADAVKYDYTTAMFIARVRDTTWFKTHTETWRQAYALQKTDPATWANKVNQQIATVMNFANTMGATLSTTALRTMATDSLMFGWDQNQIQQHVAAAIQADSAGNFHGAAGGAQARYTEMVHDYGVGVSNATVGSWVRKAAVGEMTDDSVRQYLISLAASKYPALAERLRAGETMQSIAEPYLQSYANILEVNPTSVSMTDPLLQQAFTAKDANGKPAVQTVWQFEQNLRNDPRWAKTQNAKNAAATTAHGILSDFGLVS